MSGTPVDFTMIPYAVWDNRSHDSGMVVMIPEIVGAKEGPMDGGRTAGAQVTYSSLRPGDSAGAVNDSILPQAWNGVDGSKDKAIPPSPGWASRAAKSGSRMNFPGRCLLDERIFSGLPIRRKPTFPKRTFSSKRVLSKSCALRLVGEPRHIMAVSKMGYRLRL